MHSTRRLRAAVPLVVVGIVCCSVGIAAAAASNISQAYSGRSSLVNGSLVSINASKNNFVEAANTANGARLVGVVVKSSDSLVAIGSDDDRLQVATSGLVNTLVSDVNGSVKNGDRIAVSPFNGIGMKAEPGTRLIGLALSSLDTTSGAASKVVADNSGKNQTIKVGYVRVSIGIGSVPVAVENDQNALQRVANSIAGHKVSTVRIVFSSFIAILALVAVLTLIYSSVFSTVTAIGRNPLAKTSIFRALFSIIALVFVTAAAALLAIYLILR